MERRVLCRELHLKEPKNISSQSQLKSDTNKWKTAKKYWVNILGPTRSLLWKVQPLDKRSIEFMTDGHISNSFFAVLGPNFLVPL